MLSSIQSTEIRRSLNKTMQHIAGFHIQKHFKTYQNFTRKNQGWMVTDCLISSIHGQKFYIQIDYSNNRFSQKIALIISSTMNENNFKVHKEAVRKHCSSKTIYNKMLSERFILKATLSISMSDN